MRVESRESSALVGRRLGEFIVREQLSSGGFGQVYRAEQPALGREAVIKVLHQRLRASETVLARFLREAKLASRLDHPYAAHIYAFGVEPDGLMWIAMELVRGTPLDRMLEASGPIVLERFVPLLERICQVVQTAHDQGIVHRDLKPANVMVLARAGQLLPKLLDLGIAKLDDEIGSAQESGRVPAVPLALPDSLADTAAPVTGNSGGRLTEDGAVIGSPYYMAPEQWLDAASADARTDIYALAVLSYEALTGKPPFAGNNRMEVARAHAERTPPPLGNGLPPALDAVLTRALAKRAGDRYGSALELASAFRAASGIALEVEGLPRLDDALRLEVSVGFPQPIAVAVAAFHAARNAHQARDAMWQIARVVTRFLGVIALAAHAHVGPGARLTDSGMTGVFRKLRERSLPDSQWLEIAADLSAAFRTVRAAYPVPELVDLFEATSSPLRALIQRSEADNSVTDTEVRALLAETVPEVERMLAQVAFLRDYDLVVATEAGATRWMGNSRSPTQLQPTHSKRILPGQPTLVDKAGVPVITLYPLLQLEEPAPGVVERLFFLEGNGRRGARLVALPESFEREDETVWDALGGLVEADPSLHSSDQDVCPYPGLAAFGAADASRFFGRERETETFVNRLRAQPMLAIVGPSGAGKSSFVQAGVIPALPESWRAVVLRPGPSPLLSLCTRLGSFLDPKVLHAEISRDPSALGTILRTREGTSTTLIVVDQLEEVFTLCDDPEERSRFLEALVRAARSADDPVRVVFTLRDDFLLHAESTPALRTRLAPAIHLLTAPSPADLLRILREPLRVAGYELDDPQLAQDMVDALRDSRNPLALLSFTASKLWELRDRRFRQLTRKAYTSLGGVGGALSQHAETTLNEMRLEEQRLVREVFRHVVTSEGTRAVIGRPELERVIGGGVHAQTVVERLVAARLLVVADSPTGDEVVEVVHEALIAGWPRLVQWRREDAEGARLRDQLRAAAKQWNERARATGLLWRGDALAEYRMWRSRHPGLIGELETAFTEASIADQRRTARRRTISIAVAFSLLAIGVVFLLVLNARVASQRARAEDSQGRAETSAAAAAASAEKLKDTLMGQFEDQGRRYLVDGDPNFALLYLDEARKLGSHGVAHDLATAFAARRIANLEHELGHTGPVAVATFTADGKRAITAGYDRRVQIWNAATGKRLLEVADEHSIRWAAIAGDDLLTASIEGTCSIWSAATGARSAAFRCGSGDRKAVLMMPDGSGFLSVGTDDVVTAWTRDGKLRATLQPIPLKPEFSGLTTPAALTPDGKLVAVGDGAGVVRIWNLATFALIATNTDHTGEIVTVRFSPDRRTLAVASADATVTTIDVRTGALRSRLQHRARVNAAVFSPDGATIATGAADHSVTIWDARTGKLLRSLAGHQGAVTSLAFSPDGHQLASASDDKTTILHDPATGFLQARLIGHEAMVAFVEYDVTGTRLITAGLDQRAILWSPSPQYDIVALHAGAYPVDFAPDDARFVTGDDDGLLRIWDRASGKVVAEVRQPASISFAVYSPDGALIATSGGDGVIRVYDASSGAAKLTLPGHDRAAYTVAWLADGRLASTGEDGTVRIWDVAGGGAEVIHRPHGGAAVYSLALSRDGLAVSTGGDHVTRLWDVRTLTERAQWSDGMKAVGFDDTGHRLVGINGSIARVWTLDGKTLFEVHGSGSFLAARWAPGGEVIVTTDFDGTLTLWDVQRGNRIAELHDGEKVGWVAMSRDLRSLATPQTLWRLPAPPASLPELIRCRVPLRFDEARIVSTAVATDCKLQ